MRENSFNDLRACPLGVASPLIDRKKFLVNLNKSSDSTCSMAQCCEAEVFRDSHKNWEALCLCGLVALYMVRVAEA